MRLLLPCLLCLLTTTFLVKAQEIPVSPFGFEIIPQLGISTITGNNTESTKRDLPTGALVLVCGTPLNERIWVESGLQFGFVRME